MEDSNQSRFSQQPSPALSNFDVSIPLRGIVLCCTSISTEKRTELAAQSEEMGAQHKHDLTSEVTHLIVGEYDTPKYRYVAKARPDVKVMMPSWIDALRDLWIHDLPISMVDLEKAHALPVFSTLKICMTGFEDPSDRKTIADLVEAHGGEYNGDLTKAITHLLTFRPEGAKYTHAKNWGLNLVSVEWLYESVERGMILDEKLYHPETPAEERGRGAWMKNNAPKSPVGKRLRDGDATGVDEGKRKIRRTASTKLNSQTGNIWGDIVGGIPEVQPSKGGQWETAKRPSASNKETGSVVSPLSTHVRQIQHQSYSTETNMGGFFSGHRLFLHGFSAKQDAVLRKFLLPNGAQIASSLDELTMASPDSILVVVPHALPTTQIPELPHCDPPIQIATEFWIERCLEAKMRVDLDTYTLGRPFPRFPIRKFESLRVCTTGFSNMELLHISKAVVLIGGTYEEIFTNEASVLICNPERQIRLEKLTSAQKWDVPIVSTDWLLHSIETGTRQPFKPYIQRFKTAERRPSKDGMLATITPYQRDCGFESSDRLKQLNQPSSRGQTRTSHKYVIDLTAFQDDTISQVKMEGESSPKATDSPSIIRSDPLLEISSNAAHKPILSPKKIAANMTAETQEAVQVALTSLLAKGKDAITHIDRDDNSVSLEGAKKTRARSRILGRAVSNVSVAVSESYSRASSVDSTATTGQAVLWPARSDEQKMGDRSATASGSNGDTQPSTQKLQYEDTEGTDYKLIVMAKMTGSKLEKKPRERVTTVASLDVADAPRASRLREKRINGSGPFR